MLCLTRSINADIPFTPILLENVHTGRVLHLTITASTDVVLSKFQTPAGLYRSLSNGRSKVGGLSNREFFKRLVRSGYYRYDLHGDRILYRFFFQLYQDVRFDELSLRFRIKKLVPCSVDLRYSDKGCDDLPNGRDVVLYQKIRDAYTSSTSLKNELTKNDLHGYLSVNE